MAQTTTLITLTLEALKEFKQNISNFVMIIEKDSNGSVSNMSFEDNGVEYTITVDANSIKNTATSFTKSDNILQIVKSDFMSGLKILMSNVPVQSKDVIVDESLIKFMAEYNDDDKLNSRFGLLLKNSYAHQYEELLSECFNTLERVNALDDKGLHSKVAGSIVNNLNSDENVFYLAGEVLFELEEVDGKVIISDYDLLYDYVSNRTELDITALYNACTYIKGLRGSAISDDSYDNALRKMKMV